MKQTNSKKPNKNFQKPKVIATTYVKKFDQFEDMIEELKNLHPEIREKIFTFDETTNVKDALLDIIEWFKGNTPDIVEGENLKCQVTLSATKVTVKTTRFFTFGWNLKYTREGFINDLEATVTILEKEGVELKHDLASMKDYIENNNWELKEFPLKKENK